MSRLAVDTSAAVPFLLRSHTHHQLVRRELGSYVRCLTPHSLAETYSVITRLPGDARVEHSDARTLIDNNFDDIVPLRHAIARRLHAICSEHSISGGAVYDAVVGLAARQAGVRLATRDGRAASTYRVLGVEVLLIGS